MARFEQEVAIARYGLATSFTESEVPLTYALKMRNRYINAAGGAEKRQGMQQKGNTVPGTPTITGIHDFVRKDGTSVLFVSGDGCIWRFDDPDYVLVCPDDFTSTARIRSVQMGDTIVFYNGVDPNVIIEDKPSVTPGTVFKRQNALIEVGTVGGSASSTELEDTEVSSWSNDTDVVVNDLLHNLTLDGYAVITAVTTASVTHTPIGSATVATGLGSVSENQNRNDGQRYEVIDLIELNIIPTDGEDDNTTTAGPGTNATTVAVSGVDFSTTDIRVGDYVRNTTRSAIAKVSAVTSVLTVTSIAGQVADDALVLLKPALPITDFAHVHFGRMYLKDARDGRKVRVSGEDNPQDFTTSSLTLDSSSFLFGSLQPQGDTVQAMASFQRFFVIGGKENLYLFEGTDPIADTTADSKDFDIIGLFPQGTVSPDSLVSIGNDAVFVTPDGVQTASLLADASQLGRANISESLKTTLRDKIKSTDPSEIQSVHYPRRSWYVLKIASQVYVFNYTAYLGSDRTQQDRPGRLDTHDGSWSLFDGKFARQKIFHVTGDGDFLCAGDGGKVYTFDSEGVYADDGEKYTTEYQSGWLDHVKNRQSRVKEGQYIRPIFDAGAAITYEITAEGEFNAESSETITIPVAGGGQNIGLATIPFTIGGSSLSDPKYPLRWRGRRARYTFKTEDTLGPDTISSFTVYGSTFGAT